MKKLICLLLALALLLPGGAVFAGDGVVEITDVDGLLAMAQAPDGHYALAADLDLGALDWTPFAFSGTLDGRGHTLYNLTVSTTGAERRQTRDGNLKPYDTVFAGLFSTLEGAEVRDLCFKGVSLNVESGEHCFAAAIAGYMDHSAIRRCSVEGRLAMVGHNVMVGLGGLAGYGCGTIEDCSADVELFFEDRCYDTRCEQFMGALLACGVADMDRCTVKIRGYDSCHGYVHNGGLCGMYYLCGMDFPYCSVCDNYVEGFISFFEDNTDRRAYCRPFRGEYLTGLRAYSGNTHAFERRETFDYSRVLRPESCDEPQLQERLTAPGCDSWGYTEHLCAVCGHSWTDSYTPPAHDPGPWETVTAPGYGAEGLERQRCVRCGETVGERAVAALIPCAGCTLSTHEARLRPGETLSLSAAVLPAEASEKRVVYTSSDESVARVDENGLVTAVGKGTAEIRAATADGFAADGCAVTVRLSFTQWLRSLLSGS